MRRRKHVENVYLLEQSIRKETFSFFSSFAAEVGGILDQLGVQYNLAERAHGSLSTHVLAEGTNITREQVYYECVGAEQYFAYSTVLTPAAKLRHRLFDRLGVKLTMLYVSEWQSLSDAHKFISPLGLPIDHALQD